MPTAFLRSAPLWAWNDVLEHDRLTRQIHQFRHMGYGGVTLHPRTGLGTPYLGPSFMKAVRACVEEGAALGQITWLYDEDRWPSGFGGGKVTSRPEFSARYMLWTLRPYGDADAVRRTAARGMGGRNEQGELLARYAIALCQGRLLHYRRLEADEPVGDGESLWYAYLETAACDPWFNHQAYVDALNPEAIGCFIRETHERYRETVGDHFGTAIPGIFTDEPQTLRKQCLAHALITEDINLPWTPDLPDSYRAAYNEEILDTLPELIWERSDGQTSPARWRYHDHLAECLAASYADQIGAWCGQHGLALTGHVMGEHSLSAQTACVGEAMRSYRSFHIPGIDLLMDRHEYATAKQAQSAKHQFGRQDMLSELFGITDWDFPFHAYKSQADWQAALGVTLRVPHLAWYSMAGEAKRDYPASMGPHSPWWAKWPLLEDHFARTSVALREGTPCVRVALIHPIESFWLSWGPTDQTGAQREEQERSFDTLVRGMLEQQIDFDFISEALLPQLCPVAKAPLLQVGPMRYEAVIVPPLRTLRSSTLDRLEAFAAAGGHLLFVGHAPDLVDVIPSARARSLADRCTALPFSLPALLNKLEVFREVDVRLMDGRRHTGLLHQVRECENGRIIFFCDTRRAPRPMMDPYAGIPDLACHVRLRGPWRLKQLDTFTGEARALPANLDDDWTTFDHTFHPHSHLLLEMIPGEPDAPLADARITGDKTCVFLPDPVPVTLDEPNALLLDQAEWRIDQENWQPREEILRIHEFLCDRHQLPPPRTSAAQPWTRTQPPPALCDLSLRFTLQCETPAPAMQLAVEQPETQTILLDGKLVPANDQGWWVDEAIRRIELPPLSEGTHELILIRPFRADTPLEWCYVLGDFGVRIDGRSSVLTAPVHALHWGDFTRQGLPFYTGNLTYHLPVSAPCDIEAELEVSSFAGSLVGVRLDDKTKPDIAFAPWRSNLGRMVTGQSHTLDLTLYGHRYNAFGALHMNHATRANPGCWRLKGSEWCYEYNIRPMGILCAPVLHGVRCSV